MDSAVPQSEGSGCGETEEVGVNDDGTLNIQLDPIPPGCNWEVIIKDADGKSVTLPVTKSMVKLPIRVEYRCVGASASEPPCKVKCYTCSEESCGSGSCSDPGDGGTGKESVLNKCVYVRIPVGVRRFGDYKTYLRLQLPANSITNPGPSALKISSGLGYSHTMNNNGTPSDPSDDYVATLTCQFGYASVAKTPILNGDSNAYTISLRTSSTASVHRTILFENTGSSFRVSSNYMSKTIITDWHPKSGTTDTFTMDQGYMNGSTFEVLRSVDKIVSQPDPGTYIIRMKVYERPSNAASNTMPSLLISDREVTYVKYSWSWQVVKRVIDPDNTKLTTTYEYFQSGEMTGPSSYAGVGRLKSMKSYDGHEELHIYDDYSHTVFTPFKGDVDAVETTVAWDANYLERTYTRKVDGHLVEKNINTYNPSTLTYTSKDYSSASNFLTTTYEYYPVVANNANSALPKRIINPDGTATLISNTQTSSARTTEIKSGAYNSGTQTITQGTQQTTVTGIHGAMEASMTTAIGTGSGTILSHAIVYSADAYGRALTTQYYPISGSSAFTTTATYDCCGMSSSTDKYGITTYYMRDDLGRMIKSNTLGVTQETLFNGLTTHSLRYDQSPPLFATSSTSTTNEVGRSVSNLADTVKESWSRSPQTGAMVKMSTTTTTYRNPLAISGNANPNGLAINVGYITSEQLIQVADDGSVTPTQTSSHYLDGNLWESSGDLAPDMRSTYQVNSTGHLNGQAYLDGTVEREASSVQQDWLGRSLTETKGSIQNTKVYTGDKLTRSYDADGVDTFYFYNSEGILTKTVLDLNGNNVADDSIDQVTISESYPGTYTPPGGSATPVVTTVQKVIVSSTTQITAQTSHVTPDGLRNWSISLGTANPSYQATVLSGSGNWTETTTMPDGTKAHQIYTSGRLAKSQQLTNDSTPAIITETTYTTYDAIGRATVVTDKRTGATTTNYLNLYTDVVASFSDSGSRTTSYSYDHRGRRTLVNQPDTGAIANETTTKYFPDGSNKEVTGDQTYRSTYTYDYAARMKTLVTYGTTTATTTWNYSTTTGQLLSKLDHANKGAVYTYTVGGRLKTRTWARDKRTRYDYDAAGRLTAKRYFLTSAADTGSNAGNDPDTGDATYSYDRLSRNTAAVVSNQSTSRPGVRVNTVFDGTLLRTTRNLVLFDPDLASITSNGSAPFTMQRNIHRKYDSLNRREGYQLRLTGLTNSTLEAETTYRYSATNGRFGAVTSNPIGAGYTTTHDFLYGYETNSNLLKTTQSFTNYNFTTNSGTAIHQATRIHESTRDALDTITSINSSTSAVISGSDYAVNEIGQRTGITRSGSATPGSASAGYTYNSRGELVIADEATNAMDRAYQFDGIGNREKSANNLTLPTPNNWASDALNRYTTIPNLPATPGYDDDGNATAYPLPIAPTANADITYDGENRQIKVVTGSTTVEYIYDALSRRVAKTVGSNRTYYVYDGWNCVAEYTGAVHTSGTAPALTRSYTHTWGLDLSGSMQGAGGVGGLLMSSKFTSSTTATPYYPCYDGNGNITAYIDNTCAVAASFDYDPFGNITNNNNTPALPYAFSTKPREIETGLYYYGYRWYDPLTGRWPSRDPIEENGGLNLYGFVFNSPLFFLDRNGLDPKQAHLLPENRKQDNPTYAKGLASLNKGLELLKAACESCCPETCPSSECSKDNCKAEATKIIKALTTAWSLNYGLGKAEDNKENEGDPVAGYYCWDWAEIYMDALSRTDLNCFDYKIGAAIVKNGVDQNNNVKPDKFWKSHWYVKVFACKKNTDTSCQVVFDDGFFDSENTSHAGLFPDKDSNYVDIKNPLGKLQRNEVQSFTRNPL